MDHFLFRCPSTGLNVQHRWDDDPDVSESEYEVVTCPACARMHLISIAARCSAAAEIAARPGEITLLRFSQDSKQAREVHLGPTHDN